MTDPCTEHVIVEDLTREDAAADESDIVVVLSRVGHAARCPPGESFSAWPPTEPDWPVSRRPALQ